MRGIPWNGAARGALLVLATTGAFALHPTQSVVPDGGGRATPPSTRRPPGPYVGPGDTVPLGSAQPGRSAVPPGAPVSGPVGPGAGGVTPLPTGAITAYDLAADLDLSTWDRWWEHNRDPYLALDAALQRLHPATPGDAGLADPLATRRAGLTWPAVYGEVVPVLSARLGDDEPEPTLRSALLALARIGEAPPAPLGAAGRAPRIAPLLAAHLDHPRQAVAETAAIALGVLGSEEGVLHLSQLLGDTREGRRMCGSSRVSIRMRALAAYGLGVAGSYLDQPATSAFVIRNLVSALEGGGLEHQDLQAACVIALGLVEAESAGQARAGDDPSTSRDAQVDYLLALLTDERSPQMVRAHAPTAVARLVGAQDSHVKARVARLFIELARERGGDPREDVRSACLVALGRMGDGDEDVVDQRIREALMDAVRDQGVLPRSFAIVSLAQVAARPGTGAGAPLAGQGEATTFFVQQLARGKSRLRPWAGLSLGLLGHGLAERGEALAPAARQALELQLRTTRSPEDAAAYALGLGLTADAEGRAALEAQLARLRDEYFRGIVAVSLGLHGDAEAVPALRGLMAEAQYRPFLKEQLSIARALLADRSLIPELVAELEACDTLPETYGTTRALAWTADHRALKPLLDFVAEAEHTDIERSLAIDALGWIGDKEKVVWDSRISAGLNYTVAPQTLTDPFGYGILDTL